MARGWRQSHFWHLPGRGFGLALGLSKMLGTALQLCCWFRNSGTLKRHECARVREPAAELQRLAQHRGQEQDFWPPSFWRKRCGILGYATDALFLS